MNHAASQLMDQTQQMIKQFTKFDLIEHEAQTANYAIPYANSAPVSKVTKAMCDQGILRPKLPREDAVAKYEKWALKLRKKKLYRFSSTALVDIPPSHAC